MEGVALKTPDQMANCRAVGNASTQGEAVAVPGERHEAEVVARCGGRDAEADIGLAAGDGRSDGRIDLGE